MSESILSSVSHTVYKLISCFFNRGDPTLVKTNVAITTGYLISGKRKLSVCQHNFVKVSEKEHAHNKFAINFDA